MSVQATHAEAVVNVLTNTTSTRVTALNAIMVHTVKTVSTLIHLSVVMYLSSQYLK